MTSEQIFAGTALIVVLAVGSQILAGRLRLPGIILLLPAGFAAGALTDDVHPDKLLGPAFSPLVSLAVAIILYDAGLELDLRRLTGDARRTVVRLIWIGTLLTWPIAALAAAPLLDISTQSAAMLGVILIVSGPTVVGPLLNFVRPGGELRRILLWEGSLIDAVGGVLGALVFAALESGYRVSPGSAALHVLSSAGVGIAGGVLGAGVLWLLLSRVGLGEILGTTTQLAAVVGIAAGCNVLRDDAGLIAAIIMGVAMATLADLPVRRPFFETLVSLIIGVLFVSISATVAPVSLRHVVLPALGLTAVLVLVARPVVAALSTFGSDLERRERCFLGWMAPRGIVAASTAATFSASLVDKGIGGAEKILPATFIVIVTTVLLYGLSAVPVARRLQVTGSTRSRPLLVGGDPWVVALGRAFLEAGLEVLMWAGEPDQRDRIRAAGLELAPGELLATAAGKGAELEGITSVLLLTNQDDFNALAAVLLQREDGPEVYRLAERAQGRGVVAPFLDGEVLFARGLSSAVLAGRHRAGAAIRVHPGQPPPAKGHDLLFTVDENGRLRPATSRAGFEPSPGGYAITLGPGGADLRGEPV
ncbi:cation:proton antiporter [Streptacidiphilus carbonis]|uniref:cation:proton antiporter n=1 Tax=Streptacidiphilus carbonis TaxID=105422 RepID=UPI0005A65E78|nr:cation:proton antiporter [Streptacidiphilus carbonis]